ncbi:MAG: hypothetical protein VZR36_01400 [Prevotella sp.]|nr:hypothetical protein [Prevotella sp.]
MIPQNEYSEIKEFLRHRVCEINRSENNDREKQRMGNTKYSLPNADSFGWMPAITICYSFDIGDKQTIYMIPFLSFYRYLSEFLPQAIYNCPDLFGTKDAKDVIAALYSVSRYDQIGDINDYQQYLIDNAYCYFLLRESNGILSSKLLRLDLFRHILHNNRNGYDFNGGLMHAYRHCSWKSYKLSSGNGESELNHLWDLPFFIGKAILTDNESEHKSSTALEENGRIWQIKYHIDPETGVYYLRTAFAKQKKSHVK